MQCSYFPTRTRARAHTHTHTCAHTHLQLYTKRIEVTRDRIAQWPGEHLAVLCEHSSLFYDLMTPQVGVGG
jgi:hypothetical protein